MKLTDFKVLTFDVYGTLIDWESGMIEGLKPLTDKVDRPLSRNDTLEAHARHESSQQRQTPCKRYQELLPIVYRRLAEEWGICVSWDECLTYGQSIKNWPAFSDAETALQYLKQHFKLVVLSNIDNESFSYSNEKLAVEFDAIYTAEDVGAYKPADKNFDYMLDKIGSIGVKKDQILHTAESLFHDHVPANKYGLSSCHIYRRYKQEGFGATRTPEKIPNFQFRFNSMAEMVQAVQKELGE